MKLENVIREYHIAIIHDFLDRIEIQKKKQNIQLSTNGNEFNEAMDEYEYEQERYNTHKGEIKLLAHKLNSKLQILTQHRPETKPLLQLIQKYIYTAVLIAFDNYAFYAMKQGISLFPNFKRIQIDHNGLPMEEKESAMSPIPETIIYELEKQTCTPIIEPFYSVCYEIDNSEEQKSIPTETNQLLEAHKKARQAVFLYIHNQYPKAFLNESIEPTQIDIVNDTLHILDSDYLFLANSNFLQQIVYFIINHNIQ